MALVSNSIPNLINGVSQQPFTIRDVSQAEAQENMISSVVDGLRRRPGSKHIVKISSAQLDSAYFHTIYRDAKERYQVVLTDGDLKVYDLEGNEQTVNFPHGKSYLDITDTASNVFKATTVADYTFILNTKKTVTMTADTSPGANNEALVVFKGSGYGYLHQVALRDEYGNALHALYQCPDGGVAANVNAIRSEAILGSIYSQLNNQIEDPRIRISSDEIEVVINTNSIYIKFTDNRAFSIVASDGFGGSKFYVLRDTTQEYKDLPKFAKNGFLTQIVGKGTLGFDAYYMKYEIKKSGDDHGVWKETIAPDILTTINKRTMPHALINQGGGEFSFEAIDWDTRQAGDDDTNPLPTFVGKEIKDIFFFKNRLGVLADENVVFSKVGDFFDFFKSTTTTLLDDGPIDAAVTHTKVSLLKHAILCSENLLLFSDRTQFILRGSDKLTPDNISLNLATEFTTSIQTAPKGLGNNIYFATDKGNYTAIREYFINEDNDTSDAINVTGHVPNYISSGAYHLTVSDTENVVVVLSRGDTNCFYIYSFYFEENKRLQSSWSKFCLEPGAKILHAEFIGSVLYTVIQRSDGVYIDSMNISSGLTDRDTTIIYHLDRKVFEDDCTLVYNSGENTTTITLPYEPENGVVRVYARATNTFNNLSEGSLIDILSISGSNVVIDGDATSAKLVIGVPFTSRYQFSELTIKGGANGNQASIISARNLLNKMDINYANTGYFKAVVTQKNRDPFEYEFTGRILGSTKNKIGNIGIETGNFSFPILGLSKETTIELISDSLLPCSFQSADWESKFQLRSRRL